jgi:hypothetical protein
LGGPAAAGLGAADWAAPDTVIVYEAQSGRLVRWDQSAGTTFTAARHLAGLETLLETGQPPTSRVPWRQAARLRPAWRRERAGTEPGPYSAGLRAGPRRAQKHRGRPDVPALGGPGTTPPRRRDDNLPPVAQVVKSILDEFS